MKRAIASPASPSARRLVQKREALIANMKSSGVAAAQAAKLAGFCRE